MATPWRTQVISPLRTSTHQYHPSMQVWRNFIKQRMRSYPHKNWLTDGRTPYHTTTLRAYIKRKSQTSIKLQTYISLTCISCTVMESILRDKIYEHMCSNGLLSTRQFGFVSGRSTMLQLLNVFLDEWTTMLETGGSVDVVYYLDFMKAFDKVPYRRLLAKAEGFGIANPWIISCRQKTACLCKWCFFWLGWCHQWAYPLA